MGVVVVVVVDVESVVVVDVGSVVLGLKIPRFAEKMTPVTTTAAMTSAIAPILLREP